MSQQLATVRRRLKRRQTDDAALRPGALVLEDGTVMTGEAFGATGEATGEVVFNTSMTGYQEILTDPSYAGQIVTMTYPLIGNYGVLPDVDQSRRPFARGLLVREWCHEPSHHLATGTIDDYLSKHGLIGLAGFDTRALTRHLRVHGTMGAVLLSGEAAVQAQSDPSPWVKKAKAVDLRGVVAEATTPEPYRLGEAGTGPHVVVVDYGVKKTMMGALLKRGCHLTVVPAQTTAEEILALKPDGILLSNGPGDPADVEGAAETAKALVDQGVPTFGICLGHQILGLAFGAESFKLTFGHRGANHPVKDLASGKVVITAQNHGYALVEDSVDHPDLEITHINLNDGTVEGLRHRRLPVFSVQYHPEAAPGPEDSNYLFDSFMEYVKEAASGAASD